MKRVLAGMVVGCALASAPQAQDQEGVVDTRPSAQEQIARLERVTSGDLAPDKMTVYLRWLADLYVGVGDLDSAQRSYERILVFDPYDITTTNLFAKFLLDQRHAAAEADTLLRRTIQWALKETIQPLYLGQTYALHARSLRELGRYEEAIEASERATERLDPDSAEDALRTEAVSLKALGRTRQAAGVFLHLIGITGGSNADDINALIALEVERRGSIDGDAFRARIRDTMEEARRERQESLRHDGAEMVVLEGEGNVRLEGTLRRGKGPNAVLFIPDLGGRRSAYRPYEQLLALDGITTFSLDPRGHGDSRCDSLPSFVALPAEHRARIPADIVTARRYLSDQLGIDPDRIAVISAGSAAADVEHAMHGLQLDALVVHLSPIFDPLDRDVASAIAFRPPRPAMMVVSEEDVYSVQSVNAMRAARPRDSVTVKQVHSSGHGVTLLHRPENFAAITNWLNDQFAAAR